MHISKTFRMTALAAVLTTFLAIPLASADPGERGGKRGGPPQEAFDACVSKVEGDVCTFSGQRGDEEGTCKSPPQGEGELACAPERGQREPRNGQESL